MNLENQSGAEERKGTAPAGGGGRLPDYAAGRTEGQVSETELQRTIAASRAASGKGKSILTLGVVIFAVGLIIASWEGAFSISTGSMMASCCWTRSATGTIWTASAAWRRSCRRIRRAIGRWMPPAARSDRASGNRRPPEDVGSVPSRSLLFSPVYAEGAVPETVANITLYVANATCMNFVCGLKYHQRKITISLHFPVVSGRIEKL